MAAVSVTPGPVGSVAGRRVVAAAVVGVAGAVGVVGAVVGAIAAAAVGVAGREQRGQAGHQDEAQKVFPWCHLLRSSRGSSRAALGAGARAFVARRRAGQPPVAAAVAFGIEASCN